MSSKLAYVASPGLIPKVLTKIQEAKRPDRFTTDFLETKLGLSGGSARALIPLLKKLGFINSDGTPTKRYDQFRTHSTQGGAVADGMKEAFSELFERNRYANDLSREKLTGLITEITGATKGDTTTKQTLSTFSALKEYADFDAAPASSADSEIKLPVSRVDHGTSGGEEAKNDRRRKDNDDVELNISYTINLNLPETDNVQVFNAIFRALSENLLKK